MIKQIMAKASGATVHTLAGLIGYYQGAVYLAELPTVDRAEYWQEEAENARQRLYSFYKTGKPECLKHS